MMSGGISNYDARRSRRTSRGGATSGNEIETIIRELRCAVRELRARGLKQGATFAAELLLGIPKEIRAQVRAQEGAAPGDATGAPQEEDDVDRYDAARASLDVGEYLRAHHMLGGAAAVTAGPKTRFLALYALYLAGEKTREEMELEVSVAGARQGEADAVTARQGENPHLKELYQVLSAAHRERTLDGFGLYLFAVILTRLGYATATGVLARSDGDGQEEMATLAVGDEGSSPKANRRRPSPRSHREEGKTEQDAVRDDALNDANTPVTTQDLLVGDASTRSLLVESIRVYPWNWSAWMELARLSPFTSNNEDAILSGACPWMFHLFQAHALLDQQQNDAARRVLDNLAVLFPHSTYLLAQQALTSYHQRDFDHAQDLFERLAHVDPHRVATMDVYSNVLYVKEDKRELSRLAHRALSVDKYRPETCCIIGNYYSLKNKHDRAIVYFTRALKLDPNFLSAWTLIGHEYVELKNTSAAIHAYRRAVALSERDYRAWYGLGQAYEILNMYLYSIYYYKKAATIRPYDARMWCALGGCYEKLQKTSDAVACFERAVGNHDREGIASYHLGRLLAQQGQPHDAAAYYRLHLGLPEESVEEQKQLSGEMMAGNGQQGGGASALPQPIAVRVDTPQALAAVLFLANYYKQLGRYADAVVFCNRLLDLQGPEKEEAKALLREIRSLEAHHHLHHRRMRRV